MRLKALLIDDEVNILRNLELVLPWEALDITIVGLAKNGVQALELATRHEPDIIFCDIRMPVMDGIQFLERLREVNESAEVIMLTGYQDFEYARSVIRHRVSEYMLKPFNYDELTAVLERLSARIRAERRAKLGEERRLGKAMGLAYEKQLYDILRGYTSADALRPLQESGQSWVEGRYALMLADADDYRNKCRSYNDQERQLWNFAGLNVLQEALASEGIDYAVLQLDEGQWAVLIERPVRAAQSGQESGEQSGLDEAAEADGLAELRRYALTLQRAVAENAKIDLSIGIYAADVSVHELAGAMKLLQKTIQLAADRDRSILVCQASSSGNKKHADALMHTAKEYIHKHIAKDMGIDELADYLGISGSYFSLLFKQHYGCTFLEYVTAERIELAKSLLLITDKSVTEIARSIGYLERRYFNKVFQKLTGELPSEYREKRKRA